MPLLTGVPVVPPPTPPVRPPVQPISVTWVAPDGGVWPLTAAAGLVQAQATSSLTAGVPVDITSDVNPRGGVDVRHVYEAERYILLPVQVRGRTRAEFVDLWRRLGDAFTQTSELGAGVLRVAQLDGTAREIDAFYWSGWEGVPRQGVDVDTAAALTLMAPKPWWRAAPIVAIRQEYSEAFDFLEDDFPQITSGQLLGASVATNPGETKAWPRWTITGPLTELTAVNHTTGEQFVLDPDWDGGGALTLGETVTITTDPPAIRGPAGEVWTGAVTGPLWGLRRGANSIEFTAVGADDGTSVELQFFPLYQTP